MELLVMIKRGLCFLGCFMTIGSFSSADNFDDLDALLDDQDRAQPVALKAPSAFKAKYIVNLSTTEMLSTKAYEFRISHRFGAINGGVSEWFGMDEASIRLGFDYGVFTNLNLGVGRSSFQKKVDTYLKWRFLEQGGAPLSAVLQTNFIFNTSKSAIVGPKENLTSRSSYHSEILLTRRFGKTMSLLLSPSIYHQNRVPLEEDGNTLLPIGVASRIALSERFNLMFEGFYTLYDLTHQVFNPSYEKGIAVGVDIETGGHVFQIHISNYEAQTSASSILHSRPIHSLDSWGYGFNISRNWQ